MVGAMTRDSSHVRGIVTIAQGDPARQQAIAAINALRRTGSGLPVAVIGDRPIDIASVHIHMDDDVVSDPGARKAKVNLDLLSPFEHTLYMDADTRVVTDEIRVGFDMLEDGWQLVITPNAHQNDEILWHVGEAERLDTFAMFGTPKILALSGGVFWFAKCAEVAALFAAWREEWGLYHEQDQAALLRAMRQSPVKTWLLGRAFNGGGSPIKHLYGWARR
jgi:hypothetical protein